MAIATAKDEEQGTAPASTPAAVVKRLATRARTVPRQKNRALAIALVGIAAAIFLTAVLLTLLFHYADVHHAFPSL